jgi:NAD(P)-dependent dehydrogenase (short-subunit alcohol dehydrogenase family)
MNRAADWLDLSGKVAHVTGGARGIGAAIARARAMAGAKVMVSDVNAEGAAAVAAEIQGASMEMDVADRAAVDAGMARTAEELGSLDILVNNAGLPSGFGGPTLEITDEIWRTAWSVNVDGVFYCSRTGARIMIDQGRGGRIINVSSTQAKTPGIGATYDAAKAAVAQMTKVMALEFAPHGINVNALAPGPTWSPGGEPPPIDGSPPAPTGEPLSDSVQNRIARLPARHWADPIEQGKAVVFLASQMSDFVTGIYLPVDGGWLTL